MSIETGKSTQIPKPETNIIPAPRSPEHFDPDNVTAKAIGVTSVASETATNVPRIEQVTELENKLVIKIIEDPNQARTKYSTDNGQLIDGAKVVYRDIYNIKELYIAIVDCFGVCNAEILKFILRTIESAAVGNFPKLTKNNENIEELKKAIRDNPDIFNSPIDH